LKQAADRRHLAEAVVLKASWFLTNDNDIITKTRLWNKDGIVEGVRVVRPSECFLMMSHNPTMGWAEHRC
jgi:hypothetical protein